MYFARATAPTGWLIADGRAVSRVTHATLFNAVGTLFGAGNGVDTFNLPDLRGEFLRGIDQGRGIDEGRALGSAQADGIRKHGHPYQQKPGSESTTRSSEDGGGIVNGSAVPGVTRPAFDGSPSGLGTELIGGYGGAETRPRNVALLACIKI
jgi:microcystin-dependent protein